MKSLRSLLFAGWVSGVAGPAAADVRVYGSIETAALVFVRAPESDDSQTVLDDSVQGFVRLQADLNWRPTDWISFDVEAFASGDTTYDRDQAFTQPGEINLDPAFVDLTAASMTLSSRNADLLLGRVKQSQGFAPIISPINVFGATEIFDPPNKNEYGRIMVQLAAYSGRGIWTLTYLPYTEGFALPNETSRWRGQELSRFQLLADDSNEAGIMASYEAQRSGGELLLGAYRGPSPYIVIGQPDPLQQASAAVQRPMTTASFVAVNLVRELVQIGGEAITVLADDRKDDDYIRWTASISRSFPNLADAVSIDDLRVDFQYLGDNVLRKLMDDTLALSSAVIRPIPDSFILQINAEPSFKTRVTTGVSHSVSGEGSAAFLEIERRVTDSFSASLRLQTFDGDPGSQLGRWRRNDYASFRLKAAF